MTAVELQVPASAGRAALALVVLAFWLGGAVLTAAVVAPAAFAALPTRALAGAVIGRILPAVFWAGVVTGAASAALAWGERGSAGGGVRVGASVLVLAACLVAQVVLAPRIARLREAIGPALDALAAADPLRAAFGRLHGLSVLALAVAMLAAGVGLVTTLLVIRARGT